ncbi:MAG: hypothetical protein A4E74_02392 [Syntrophus sp. PtaB.Bin075]|nr:MAG: hypothetical protein A4E74_02392 [Syntrophus sp. PtaB.Bin075]
MGRLHPNTVKWLSFRKRHDGAASHISFQSGPEQTDIPQMDGMFRQPNDARQSRLSACDVSGCERDFPSDRLGGRGFPQAGFQGKFPDTVPTPALQVKGRFQIQKGDDKARRSVPAKLPPGRLDADIFQIEDAGIPLQTPLNAVDPDRRLFKSAVFDIADVERSDSASQGTEKARYGRPAQVRRLFLFRPPVVHGDALHPQFFHRQEARRKRSRGRLDEDGGDPRIEGFCGQLQVSKRQTVHQVALGAPDFHLNAGLASEKFQQPEGPLGCFQNMIERCRQEQNDQQNPREKEQAVFDSF